MAICSADVIYADSNDEIRQFIDSHKQTICSLMFYTPKSANVFNLFGLFSWEETDSNFEAWINEYASLMKVDASNK